MNIYVGNLSSSVKEEDLNAAFIQHGQVNSVRIILDAVTREPRGFGFVEMPNETEGHKAIRDLNNKPMKGKDMTVNEARPKTAGRSNSPRRY